jgi:hypothetical protein
MAVSLPNGITFALAVAYALSKSITVLTNDEPAVATSAGHGLITGDFVEITSGWSKLQGRIARVVVVSPDTFELEEIDTTDTNVFPVGTGIGAFRRINTWQQITQVLDVTTSGGDMQFANYSFLENDFESQLPTQSSAQSMTISVADDASLPGYKALKKVAATRNPVALKGTFPNGAPIAYNGYLSFNEEPGHGLQRHVLAAGPSHPLLDRDRGIRKPCSRPKPGRPSSLPSSSRWLAQIRSP